MICLPLSRKTKHVGKLNYIVQNNTNYAILQIEYLFILEECAHIRPAAACGQPRVAYIFEFRPVTFEQSYLESRCCTRHPPPKSKSPWGPMMGQRGTTRRQAAPPGRVVPPAGVRFEHSGRPLEASRLGRRGRRVPRPGAAHARTAPPALSSGCRRLRSKDLSPH